jgi:Ran GTPase-activating protein (RanGAP) involved in mRNA processing and transport
MTTLQLQLNGLCGSDFPGKTMTKSFAGVLEGVLGQSAEALTHLELTCNCLGSDGVSRLAKVLTQCTALTWLSLVGNDLEHDGANIVATVLCQCPVLVTLDLQHNVIGCHGALSLARE